MVGQKAEQAQKKCLASCDEEPKTSRPLLGSADSMEPAQELGEIGAGGGDLMAFVQVLQPAQSGPPHAASVEHVVKAVIFP